MREDHLICLDLEGTLISNAVSQIPRPHLASFLNEAEKLGRLVLYTSVSHSRTVEIQRLLVSEGTAPSWFIELESLHPEGTVKPIQVAQAHSPECLHYWLVDDQERCIKAGEGDWWIEVKEFMPPYDVNDSELRRVAEVLKDKVSQV